jgi:peptide/nickel transport system ATP-binding protein
VDHVFNFALRKFNLAGDRTAARQRVEEALEVVGLRPDGILGKYPHELSGGQRQRIMIARAFLLKPRLIIADEPVSMIDASLQVRILDIFERLKNEFGISFLYITHDLSTAYQISDDIYVLYLGSVMEAGRIDAVMQRPTHPYTRLLVDSIPTPDPRVRWEGGRRAALERAAVTSPDRCKFYPNCARAAASCARTVGWHQVADGHWVTCA